MDRHFKCFCDLLQIVERDIPYLTLHVGDKRSVQAAFEGQGFLRPTLLIAQANNVRRENCAG